MKYINGTSHISSFKVSKPSFGISENSNTYQYLMHHAIVQDTIVPWGTALCGATLHPPEVK